MSDGRVGTCTLYEARFLLDAVETARSQQFHGTGQKVGSDTETYYEGFPLSL